MGNPTQSIAQHGLGVQLSRLRRGQSGTGRNMRIPMTNSIAVTVTHPESKMGNPLPCGPQRFPTDLPRPNTEEWGGGGGSGRGKPGWMGDCL